MHTQETPDLRGGGGGTGLSSTSAGGKRGRPFSAAAGGAIAVANAAANAEVGSTGTPPVLLGPSLQVHNSFAGQSVHLGCLKELFAMHSIVAKTSRDGKAASSCAKLAEY
eukprot:Gb_38444 [translate_table: standard]